MFTQIKLFLKNKQFRSLIIARCKYALVDFLGKPFRCLKARWEAYMFFKEHPDRWERYVALKKIEKDNEYNALIYDISVERMKITHGITNMMICYTFLLSKSDENIDTPALDAVPEEELISNYESHKSEVLQEIEEATRLGAKMRKEFIEMVKDCNIGKFDSLEELRDYSEKMRILFQDFKFPKKDY